MTNCTFPRFKLNLLNLVRSMFYHLLLSLTPTPQKRNMMSQRLCSSVVKGSRCGLTKGDKGFRVTKLLLSVSRFFQSSFYSCLGDIGTRPGW